MEMSGLTELCGPDERAGTMITRSTQEEGRLRVHEQVLHGKLRQVQGWAIGEVGTPGATAAAPLRDPGQRRPAASQAQASQV